MHMTEYRSGFISSIIDRSDQILNRGHYDVTRLLMLLSVGYAMVWERLKFRSNDKEQNISISVKGNKFEKSWESRSAMVPSDLDRFSILKLSTKVTSGSFMKFWITSTNIQ